VEERGEGGRGGGQSACLVPSSKARSFSTKVIVVLECKL